MRLKITFLALILSAICYTTRAQDKEFGALVSWENSTAKYDVADFNSETDSKSGFGLRVYAYKRLIPFLGIRGEIGYVTWGGKAKVLGVTSEQSLNYLLIPTLLMQANVAFIRGYAGPQIGILVGAKNKTGGYELDNKSDFKTVDFSGVIGVEASLPLHLLAGVRYNFGFADISDIGGTSYKNRAISLYAGIRL